MPGAVASGPPTRGARFSGADVFDQPGVMVSAVENRQSKRIVVFVLAWTGAAILAALFLYFWDIPRASATHARPSALAVFLVATVVAEAVALKIRHQNSDEVVTLVEAAVAANILLFPTWEAFTITTVGVALAHSIHRRPPIKLAFNIAQYAASTAVALVVYHVMAGGSEATSARSLISLACGMIAFGFVNEAAVAGIVSILENKSFRAVYREGARLVAISVFGNTAVGIIGAVMWLSRPELSPLIIVPALTLHLAYKGVVRSGELLEDAVSQRDRLGRIVDGASDGIVLLDPRGRVDVWSPAMNRLTGISEEAVKDRNASGVLNALDSEGNRIDLLVPMRSARPESPVVEVEMTIGSGESVRRIVVARHTVLFDTSGACIGDAILVRDVTRDRELEVMKDDFIARVSHELRTPLTPIKGYAQTLIRRGEDVPLTARNKALGEISERVDHMMVLVDDLLLVSRIMAGKADLKDQIRPETIDVISLCRRIVDTFRVGTPERSIELDLGTGVPPVTADRTRVEQIVNNLLSNACKYSDKDKPMALKVGSDDSNVLISVVDQGRGIPASQIGTVFDRFHRLENPLTMTTGGMGLGLYISRELAHAMGGELTVMSRVGEGSTFTLHLPCPS